MCIYLYIYIYMYIYIYIYIYIYTHTHKYISRLAPLMASASEASGAPSAVIFVLSYLASFELARPSGYSTHWS